MAAWSERKLIDRIRKAAQHEHADVLLSIGDDCCELATTAKTLLSTDTLVESVHFDTMFHPPFLLGRKSIAVNLSDIAAMGGTPRFVLLSLCLPPDLAQEWIGSWLDGALSMLQEFDCILVGGDTVQGKSLAFTITVLGVPQKEGALYRSGAAAGDSVWVTGVLGSSGAGLALLQRQQNPEANDSWASFYDAHLNPSPRVHLGQKLARSGCVTAMQDISDGLATDLAHLCRASQIMATVDFDQLPMYPSLPSVAAFLDMSLSELLLSAGEDYQLVFTVREGKERQLTDFLGPDREYITNIGKVTDGKGVFLLKEGKHSEITFQGYEHL